MVSIRSGFRAELRHRNPTPILVAVVTLLIFTGNAASQTVAPARADDLRFEIASVKPFKVQAGGGDRTNVPPSAAGTTSAAASNRFFSRESLFALILRAYGLHNCLSSSCALISGGPGWIQSEFFEIDARVPDGYATFTMQQFAAGQVPEVERMLRNLLADRFGLTIHTETREQTAYALTIAKQGSKLTRADPASRSFVRETRPSVPGAMGIRGVNVTLPQLATALSGLPAVGKAVIDRTGLTGGYDFTVEFAGDTDSDAPSLLPALEEKLGLRLEAAKIPVEVLVIERVERPTAN